MACADFSQTQKLRKQIPGVMVVVDMAIDLGLSLKSKDFLDTKQPFRAFAYMKDRKIV